MDAGHTFVERLVREAPPLKPVYDRHMLENMGELLPHVFMGELTRFVIDEQREEIRSGAPRPVLGLVLRELEAGLAAGDPDTRSSSWRRFSRTCGRRKAPTKPW
jgi:hypothetical protein